MKVLISMLEARLRRTPPLTITAVGLCCVLAIGVVSHHAPRALSLHPAYLAVVFLVGWGAGIWPAMLISGAIVITVAMEQWFLPQAFPNPYWLVYWNTATRLATYAFTAWLSAELGHLTRSLRQLVAERTAELQVEAERHKETAAFLAEAVERFEQIANNISEAFWLSNVAKTEVTYISSGYERIWGRKCEGVYREPASWLAAVHPEDRERVRQRTLQDQSTGAYDVEYRIIRPDGSIRWIRDRAFPVCNARGEVFRIAGVAEDITEWRTSREILQTQAAILESMAEGVVVTDEEGHVIQMNPAAEQMMGYTQSEMLGQSVTVFSALPEAEATALLHDLAGALKAAGKWRGIFKNRRKDGVINFCEAVIARLEIHGRSLLVAVEQDITERLRAEQTLTRQRALYRSLFELCPDGILLEDLDGNILEVNESLCQRTGYSREELLGQNVRRLMPTEDQAKVAYNLAALQSAHSLEQEVWSLTRSGERQLIRLNERLITLPDGRQSVMVVTRDITVHRRLDLTRDVFESLGAQLSATRTPVEAARAVFASADRLWKWDAASLDLYSRESGQMESVLLCDVLNGKRCDVPTVCHIGPPTVRTRQIMREGSKLILCRTGEAQPADVVMFGDLSRPSASLMYATLRRDGEAVGLLSIQSYTPNAYTQEDLRTFQALADYCGGAMDRIRTEEALRQREELNRTILTTAMDGLYALDFGADPAGAITEVNDAYCKISGYSREELLRMRMADIEAMESAEEIGRHKDSIIKAGTERFETRHRRKDGKVISVEISASGFAGGSGKVFGFARDITGRKRTELMREILLSLGARLIEAQSPLAAARTIFAAADQLWQWDAAVLQLYSAEQDRMSSILLVDVVDGERREVSPGNPHYAPSLALRRVMRDGPELTLRTQADMRRNDFLAFGSRERMSASLLYVPLRREGKSIGVLSIQSYAFDAFNQEDLLTLQALADHCGGALDRIHAEVRLREAHCQLERRVEERTMELLKSEQNYRRLHESMTDAFIRTDMSGRIVESNPALREMLSYSQEELRHLSYLDLTPEKWHAMEERIVAEQILPRGHSGVYEKEYRRKDGSAFPVELRTFLIRDDSGQPAAMWAIVRDITERKQITEALREANERLEQRVIERTAELRATTQRLQLALDAGSIGTWTWSFSDDQLDWDERLRSWYEAPEATRQGGLTYEFWRSRVHPDDAAKAEAVLMEARHRDIPYDHEFRVIRSDGSVRYIHSGAVIEHDGVGKPVRMIGINRDITGRKLAEETIRGAERLQNSILQNIPDPVWLKDIHGRFLAANQALARLYARPLEAIVGKTLFDILGKESNQMEWMDSKVMQTRGRMAREVSLVDQHGQPRWFETIKSPLLNEQEEVTGTVGIAREITERKQTEFLLRVQRDLGASLSLTSDVNAALKRFLGIAVKMGGVVDCGGVYLPDEAGKAVNLAVHYGISDSFARSVAHFPAGSPQMKLVQQGSPVFASLGSLPFQFDAAQLREGLRALAIVPMHHEGRPIGVLILGTHTADVIPVHTKAATEAIAAQAAGAIARIRAESERHRLERQLLEVTDREQARIGQDIHDGLCQRLVVLAFDTNSLLGELSAAGRPEARKTAGIAAILDEAITEARQLSRGLFPVRLEGEGLPPALEELAKATRERFKVGCQFRSRGKVTIKDSSIATHLYRIAQEAVTNAAKHSQARIISIRLAARGGRIELKVEDDGNGFDPHSPMHPAGMGLHIMNYRARSIGGTLRIGRRAGSGTVVLCCVSGKFS
ncbi:MAG: PAS domain S-box protein [Verrucomicrobiota bacterium]